MKAALCLFYLSELVRYIQDPTDWSGLKGTDQLKGLVIHIPVLLQSYHF